RAVPAGDGTFVGEIVFSDHLANGAGFTRRVSETWGAILAEAVHLQPPHGSVVFNLVKDDHRNDCDSSCYDCLRKYRNMSYHGLLDWRLGLSLLRLLAEQSYACGLDGDFSSPDLDGWLEHGNRLRDTFCAAFECEERTLGELPGATVGDRAVILKHPLWDER